MIQIILLSGKQGSGKTTLCAALRKALYRVPGAYNTEITLAGPIRAAHDHLRGLIEDAGLKHPPGVERKDGALMQWLGTEWGRARYGQDVWLEVCRGAIDKFVKTHETYAKRIVPIVSDVRFRNEFDAFPQALRVRLECPEDVRRRRAETWRENITHPSEVDLDWHAERGSFDMTFDTSLTSIEQQVELILAQLYKGNWVERRTEHDV